MDCGPRRIVWSGWAGSFNDWPDIIPRHVSNCSDSKAAHHFYGSACMYAVRGKGMEFSPAPKMSGTTQFHMIKSPHDLEIQEKDFSDAMQVTRRKTPSTIINITSVDPEVCRYSLGYSSSYIGQSYPEVIHTMDNVMHQSPLWMICRPLLMASRIIFADFDTTAGGSSS